MHVMLLIYIAFSTSYVFLEFPLKSYKDIYFDGQLGAILGTFLSIIDIFRGTLFAIANLVVDVMIFISWMISKKFENSIELLAKNNDDDPEMGYCLYSKIKYITETINSLSNGLVLIMYLEGLTYLVDCIGATSHLVTETRAIGNFLINATLFLCSYLLACEFHRKVRHFSDLLIYLR